jgi:rare lipoprotein A
MQKTIGLSLALLVASGPAMAKQARAGHHDAAASAKSRAAPARASRPHHHAVSRLALRAEHSHHRTHARAAARRYAAVHHRVSTRHVDETEASGSTLPPPDQYISTVRAVGRPQIGKAAWYGGGSVGQATASGEPLDTVHITAAHRTLPLYTKVLVTNLRNGRSVIATINDRGPVSHRLLIDLSPRAARELHMMSAGIAPVSIEPVAVTRTAAASPRYR